MGTGITGLYRRGNAWVVDKVVHGIRIYCSLGNIPRLDAEHACAKKVSDAMSGRLPAVRHRSLTVHDILSTFWLYKLKDLASASRAPYYLSAIDDGLGNIRCADLSLVDIVRYTRSKLAQTTRYGRPMSYRTVEMGLDLLACAIAFAIKNRDILINPVPYMKQEIRRLYAPREQREIVLLDRGLADGPEWLALYNAASASLRPILTVLYETGLRKAECLALRWQWIDMVAGVIRLPGMYLGDPVTKSRSGRLVPLSQAATDCLAGLEKQGEFVFNRSGNRLKTIDKGFRAARARAGIDQRFTIHCLRKQRATIWNRVDEYAAMRALGHNDRQTHRNHYAAVNDDRIRALVCHCGTFAGLQGYKMA